MRLTRAEYKEIVRWTEHMRPTRQCMKMLKERFPNHSQSTLLSIFSLEYQKRTKRTISRHHAPDAIESYYQRYLSAAKAHPAAPVLLEMAIEVDLSPALMARLILDRFLQGLEGEMPSKTTLNSMLKEPSLIPDHILANNIYQGTKTRCVSQPEWADVNIWRRVMLLTCDRLGIVIKNNCTPWHIFSFIYRAQNAFFSPPHFRPFNMMLVFSVDSQSKLLSRLGCESHGRIGVQAIQGAATWRSRPAVFPGGGGQPLK
ncbi:CDAN1-interacting nuclease 1 isoform X2 [Nelusetta ayraudi]|uniref:CDAN1-interacting nuclease 1 isoform X2 n=1 Tax=Nelusetta ayraudi TaxID=303726 RepID=UPI003F72719F